MINFHRVSPISPRGFHASWVHSMVRAPKHSHCGSKLCALFFSSFFSFLNRLLFNEQGITQPHVEQVTHMKYACFFCLKVRNLVGQGILLKHLSRCELPQHGKQPS